MRLTHTRLISQAFFLVLFLWLVFVADFSRIRDYPVSLFLEIDPLLAIGTALAGGTVYMGMLLSLVVLLPTIFMGRFFCGWVCPLGTLNRGASRVFRVKERSAWRESNRYRSIFAIKYYVLVVLLVLCVFGINQVGLLDPIALLTRAMSTAVYPALGAMAGRTLHPERVFHFAWMIGAVLLAVLVLNAVIPRFFCRVLCPLGALLGVVSRLSIVHVHRDEARCSGCNDCVASCPGAADPHIGLRKSECLVCLECRQQCPEGAIALDFLPSEREVKPLPDISRRRLIWAGSLSLVSVPLVGASVRLAHNPDPRLMRPPGAREESRFLESCIRCAKCMKVCPTGTVQPALSRAGLGGVWTPFMDYDLGYCEPSCVLCTEVCPTGALRRLSVEQKLGREPFGTPVRLGTAFIDQSRCLPWSMKTHCLVCEEVCPVSPKAIRIREIEVRMENGEATVMRVPMVDPAECIGCGLCQHMCPVRDLRAIRVSSVGESRSDVNILLL